MRIPMLACLAIVLGPLAGHAQPAPSHAAETPRASVPAPADPGRLPADAASHQTLALLDRTLRFTASAGAVRLADDRGTTQAEIAFVAYEQDDADHRTRPVTFVLNGGPGMASGWLNVGAIGPWRVDLTAPSGAAEPRPNAETWLDFTDLVFIDPPDTGYSRIVSTSEDLRRRLFSVDGDVDALAEAIRRWLDRHDRDLSPKYLVGESYGGFRGPRLTRRLASDQGVGLSGLVLLSPLLDLHVEGGFADPFTWADRLPSIAAAARAAHGTVTRQDVAAAEAYAGSDYITDLIRGPRDQAAVDRMSAQVASLTGLDPALVRRYGGRLDTDVALHELQRANRRVASVYDATITSPDPFPSRPMSLYADPVLEGFKPVVTMAMMSLYQRIGWRPEGVYNLANDNVFARWNWGGGLGRPQSVSMLQSALALDPNLKVLVAHGLYDLRTPYFTSARLLAQLPSLDDKDRLRLAVYPGGHMFYSEEGSRAAFRADARALYNQ